MPEYYMIKVKLTKSQLLQFHEALQHFQPIIMTFRYSQLDHEGGEAILVTKAQFNGIQKSMMNKKGVRIKFSQKQLQEMHSGMMAGHGILDSIGSFFKNSFNSAKNFVSSKLPKKNSTVTTKPNAPKPVFKDYGQQYDHMPPGYVPPKKTGLDYVAHKIGKFDNMINNTFGYNTTRKPDMTEWKQQKLGYGPNGFMNDDSHF